MTAGEAGVVLGVSESQGWRWLAVTGGIRPGFPSDGVKQKGRLTFAEREEIAAGVVVGESINSIARRIGRWPSTVMREIDKNGGGRGSTGCYRRRHRFGARQGGGEAKVTYRPSLAQQRSETRAGRARAGKLTGLPELRLVVQDRLDERHSPEQISGWLRLEFPDRPEMQVSHETIYKTIYLQGRGELRRELHACLRTGRALRKPRRITGERRGRVPGMVNISQRPAEAQDRAVPGHREGDLIIGADQASQIGTLVERSTGFLMLLHLPDDRRAETVAMITTMRQLPQALRRTPTWDQGREMAQHARIALATDLDGCLRRYRHSGERRLSW